MAELPSEQQFGDYGDWPGRQVLDPGGERLGTVREIYLDRETHQPEWVLVAVDGGDDRFVPLADAAVEDGAIRVAHARETVAAAPGIGTSPRIDPDQERRLYEHYGVPYSEDESSTVLPEPEPPTTPGLTPTESAAPEAATAVEPPQDAAPAEPPQDEAPAEPPTAEPVAAPQDAAAEPATAVEPPTVAEPPREDAAPVEPPTPAPVAPEPVPAAAHEPAPPPTSAPVPAFNAPPAAERSKGRLVAAGAGALALLVLVRKLRR